MNTFMKLDDMLTCSCTDRNDDHPPPENENENENEKGSSPVLSVFCLSPARAIGEAAAGHSAGNGADKKYAIARQRTEEQSGQKRSSHNGNYHAHKLLTNLPS